MAKIRNLKSFRKNQLIKIIRNFEEAIKLNCYKCMGGQKKIDCELGKCSLYSFRPWAKKKTGNDFVISQGCEIKKHLENYEND